MNKKEWLQGLTVGDTVVVNGSSYALAKVDRVTKTQIVIKRKNGIGHEYDVKYSKDGGYLIGSGKWHVEYIEIPTPELLEKIADIRDRNRLNKIASGKLSIQEVRAMLAAYNSVHEVAA